MPSDGFARFLRQLGASGPEKGDGFGASDVADLEGDERSQARRLLVEAIDRGDDTAPDGLVLLDGRGAVPALEAAVARLSPDNSARLTAAWALWRQTQDPRFVQVIAGYLADPFPTTRLIALGFLKSVPRDARLVAPLARVAESDADENNRAIAGELLLYTLGQTSTPDAGFRERREVMRAITYGGPEQRRRVVGGLVPRS